MKEVDANNNLQLLDQCVCVVFSSGFMMRKSGSFFFRAMVGSDL